MKKLFITILFLIIYLFSNAQHLDIIKATSRDWMGGRKEAGFGKEFRIYLKTTKKIKKIAFTKFFTNQKCYNIESYLVNNNIVSQEANLQKGDTITIIINTKTVIDSQNNKIPNSIECSKNFTNSQLQNKNIIEYTIKKRVYLFNINEFQILPQLLYP